jgi:hypothetical protein
MLRTLRQNMRKPPRFFKAERPRKEGSQYRLSRDVTGGLIHGPQINRNIDRIEADRRDRWTGDVVAVFS